MRKNKTNFLLLLGIFALGVFALMPASASTAKAASTYHIELWYDNSGHYGDTEDDVALMLKNQLDATGKFDVELKSTDWATYKSQFGTMPAFLLGWWFDYPDESNYIDPFVGGGAFDLGTNYTSSTMDGYIKTMLESSDASARATAQKNAQKLMKEDVPVVPLFSMTKQFIAYGADMTGVALEPSETLHFNSLKKGSTVVAVTLGTTDSIPTLDPADVYEYFSSNTLLQLSHGLFELPVDGTTATPFLVNSYKVTNGGITYTFDLKPNVKFTDGSDLRVEDAIWSLNRSESLNGDPAFLLEGIDSSTFVKINSTAFSFNLTNVDGTFFQKLTYTNAFIFKQNDAINNTLQGSGYKPIGLGPYYVDSWTPNDEIVLKASNNYTAGALGTLAPNNTQVTVKFFTTSASLKSAIETGTVDIAFHTFTPDEIVALEASSTVKTASKSTAGIRYLMLNVDAHTDKSVRQAISYSIDRSEFVDTIFANTNTELYSMVPPIFDNACVKGDDCAFPDQDLTKVNTLMTAYGTTSASLSTTPSSSTPTSSTPGFEIVTMLLSIPVLAIVYSRKKNN
jgi:ABC-type transport system substrate-binding protein